jgi:hypothetical protein
MLTISNGSGAYLHSFNLKNSFHLLLLLRSIKLLTLSLWLLWLVLLILVIVVSADSVTPTSQLVQPPCYCYELEAIKQHDLGWYPVALCLGQIWLKSVQKVPTWHKRMEGQTDITYQVKSEVAPVLNTLSTTPWKHMGEWRYSSTILDLRTRWRLSGQLHARPLYPWGKRPRYQLDRRLGGPQSRSGRCGEDKILLLKQPHSLRPVWSSYICMFVYDFTCFGS